jgi:hypothetical protein
MSAASPPLPIVARRVARWCPTAEVSALARIEGRQLLWHPVFLIGLALSSLYFIRANEGMVQTFVGTACWGFFPLAASALIAAYLAATRSRRDGAEDLYRSLPHPRSTRIAGQLLGLLWTLPVAGALIGAAYLNDTFIFTHTSAPQLAGRALPLHPSTSIELVYGPVVVVAFGAIGILLARVALSPIVGPLMIVAIFAAQVPAWNSGGDSWDAWLLPMWNDVVVASGTSNLCEPGSAGPGCGVILRHLPGIGWHLSYLIGVALLAGAGALVRGRRRLPFAVLAVLAAALAITTRLAAG